MLLPGGILHQILTLPHIAPLLGRYLYSVFTFTPITSATCCRVAPFSSILRHRSTTSSVITRRRPPTLPCSLAAANPARVRSTISSRSISARALMTWKKHRKSIFSHISYGDHYDSKSMYIIKISYSTPSLNLFFICNQLIL